MTRERPDREPSLSLDAARQIDELCDSFESAWIARPPARIEDYLVGTARELRREAVRELIQIDLIYRRRKGEQPKPSDYTGRFTEIEETWVESVLASKKLSRPARGSRSRPGDTVTLNVAATLAASQHTAIGQFGANRRIGEYELIEEIARGGMGVVFKARQAALDRVVAVKMILSGQLASPDDVERFRAEAQAAANLDHPGIVPIFEVGEQHGQHFFSMGFVDGQSLAARVAEGPLSPDVAARLVRTVCDAVQYAHDHHVVHRDLKPANILLDRDGRPRVTDFGLAKRVQGDSGLTATGQILGTPSFMPPEQAAGNLSAVGPPSDVYSLGAILYTLLTGRPPFQAASSVETLRLVLDHEPVSPRALAPDIPRDLETIALKCLEKSIPGRYATARELADELDRYLDRRPILARPIGPLERGWRWCRRNRGAAALLTVSAGLLLIVALGSVAAAILINASKDDAVSAKNEAVSAKNTADVATRGAILAKNDAEAAKGKALTLLDEKTKLAAEKSALANEMRKTAEEKSALASNMSKLAAEKSALADAMSKLATERANLALALTREVFELGASEQARGNTEAAIAIMAQVHAASAENSPLRKSAENLLGALIDSEPYRLPHQGAVNCVTYSPDGSTVVTGSEDHTARLWDARTGRPVGEPMKHDGAIFAVAYSPDGSLVLTGSEDHTARLWNARTGRPFGDPLKHEHIVWAVAFAPDGSSILTGSQDDTARLWDAHTGKPIGEPMRHAARVRAVAYSPDGATVVTVGDNNLGQLWNARTTKPMGTPLKHDGPVVAVAFSPDGNTVLTGSFDKTAQLWNARTGISIGQPLRHPNKVLAVAYSPDGAKLLTASADHTAHLWTKKLEPIGKPLRHDGPVLAVAWSPDQTTVLTGSADKVARLWNADTGEPVGEPMKHDGLVGTVAYSPDGMTVLTGGGAFDETARIWDARSEKRIAEPMRSRGTILAVAFSANGTLIAIGSSDGMVIVRNSSPAGNLVRPIFTDSAASIVTFSPDGKTLLSGDSSGAARLWTPSGTAIGQPIKHTAPIQAAAYSRDGTMILTGSEDHSARLWNAWGGNPIGQPMMHDGAVLSVAISPDSMTFLTGSSDHTARLWNAQTGQPIGRPMKHADKVSVVAFSPDGTTVLTGSDDKTAQLWSPTSGEPIGQALKHGDKVIAIGYSPDGTTIITGSDDKMARIWDVRTQQQIGESMKHGWSVNCVAFSPDGAAVLTGSGDTTARIWDAQTGKPLCDPMKHNDKIETAAYSPTEPCIVTACDKTATIWEVSRPIPTRLVALASAARSGMRMDDSGNLVRLSTREFFDCWKHLDAEGAKWLADQRWCDGWRRDGWHGWQEAEAKSKGNGFAAVFHLKWLLSATTANDLLRQRLDGLKKLPNRGPQSDKPVGVQFNAWFYSAGGPGSVGVFRKEKAGWVESIDGKTQARFKETARSPDYVELFDEPHKHWIRLTLVDSSDSGDHATWTATHKGSPNVDLLDR